MLYRAGALWWVRKTALHRAGWFCGWEVFGDEVSLGRGRCTKVVAPPPLPRALLRLGGTLENCMELHLRPLSGLGPPQGHYVVQGNPWGIARGRGALSGHCTPPRPPRHLAQTGPPPGALHGAANTSRTSCSANTPPGTSLGTRTPVRNTAGARTPPGTSHCTEIPPGYCRELGPPQGGYTAQRLPQGIACSRDAPQFPHGFASAAPVKCLGRARATGAGPTPLFCIPPPSEPIKRQKECRG